MRKAGLLRAGAVALGTLVLTCVGSLAFAEETKHGEGEVALAVAISQAAGQGVLAMAVDGDAVTLTENGSTATVRQFTGTLPDVTVTDTRDPEDIDPGVFWWVECTATDFEGDAGQADITADHLGWAPAMIDDGGSGRVDAGDPVDTVMDAGPNNVGLVGQEFLATANSSSQDIAEEGAWTANAELFLKVPATVAPGDYSSTLTLSLFE